jgi:hypothetical protein
MLGAIGLVPFCAVAHPLHTSRRRVGLSAYQADDAWVAAVVVQAVARAHLAVPLLPYICIGCAV